MTRAKDSSTIRFILDGEVIELRDVDPTRTVLQFLREDLRRTGTKEGCAEGDCGACTVVLAELDRDGDRVRTRAVNACIQFVPTLHGKELITVESLRGDNGELHPVQRAMIDCHGSQCGFCTPGFVMSLFAMYETMDAPTRTQIDDALAGNLCRCTGYRPIIAAARAMYELPAPASEVVHAGLLAGLDGGETLRLTASGRQYFAPVSSRELVNLLARHPRATLLAGGTDVGLWVTKQHRDLDTVIYTGRVAELTAIEVGEACLRIGAAVPLSDAMDAIVGRFPGLEEMFRRFASPPIRNAATLGGNVANGSPIGDSMPALMVLGATLLLRSAKGTREITLDEFYIDYQVNALDEGEFIEAIRIPLSDEPAIVRCHKLSKRFDQDISAVCAAYRLRLDGDRVASFRMACGGLAATVKRARQCESVLAGAEWSAETVAAAAAALAADFTPITDMRATAGYRLRGVQNLLKRFYLETRGQLDQSVYAYGR